MLKFYLSNSRKIEVALLFLALLSIFAYLCDLLGTFRTQNLKDVYEWCTLTVDLIFVLDFFVKIAVLRSTYLRGPWWMVDFIATLPILAFLGTYLQLFEGLRIARTVRYFYILRVIRIVRLTQLFKFMQFDSGEKESKQFKYTIWICTLSLSSFLVLTINYIHSAYPAEVSSIMEFYLILGLLVSVVVCLLIVRVQIPEVTRSEIKKLLNIALPRQVAESFLKNPKLMHDTIEMPATILFSDLTDFTSAVEDFQGNHQEIRKHLQKSLGVICEEHAKENLIIDKFMGDCVMSFKGGNLVDGTPAEHAFSVVQAALASAKVLGSSNLSCFNKLKIGGASTDTALIGAFGTEKRLSYTVLGDAVNLASRLETASKQCGVTNLFCEKTKELTDGNNDFIWREVGNLFVAGKKKSVRVFEALPKSEANQKFIELFHEALNFYKSRSFEEARNLFKKALNEHIPEDQLTEKYIQSCREALEQGVPENWTHELVIRK